MKDWSLDEDVVLFAWLDFCNENEINFQTTIEQELKKKTNISRSTDAIKLRLRNLELKFREPVERDKINRSEFIPAVSVIQMGSKVLRFPPKAMERKIKVGANDYKRKYTSKEIQRLKEPDPMKNDRGKIQVQVPARKSPSGETRIIPATRTWKQPQVETGNSKKRNSREEIEEVSRKKRCLTKNTEPPRPESQAQNSRKASCTIVPTSKNAKPNPPSGKPTTKAVTSTGNKELKIPRPAESPSIDQRNDKVIARLGAFSNVNRLDDQARERTSENLQVRVMEDLKSKDAEISAIREQWDLDLRELHGKIEKLQRTKLELEAKVSNQEAAAIQVKNAGRNPLEYEIGQKNIEIWKLTDKIHRQFEVPSVEETETKYLSPLIIDTAMNEIRLELEAMIQVKEFPRILSPSEWFDGDLEYLVNSAFATPKGSMEGKHQLQKLDGRLGPSAVFSILAVTALRDWVFLTDFPHIEVGPLGLIESYRNITFDKGGWCELRCLDFGAFKNHMKQPHFNDILDRTSKQLACRLSRTLSFLFSKKLVKESHDYSFHTWGEDFNFWNERKCHSEKLFCTALKLKSNSVITDATYTFEFSSNKISIKKPFDESGIPEGYWLGLSIRAYKSELSVSQDEKESALVQTRNFSPSVPEDWFCDYRKDVYFGVDESHKTRRISQSSRHEMIPSASSGTNLSDKENAIDSEQPNLSGVARNNGSPTVKVPTQASKIPRLPKEPSCQGSINTLDNTCKFCAEVFRSTQGLSSHYRAEVLPTNHNLRQHMKSEHMQQSEETESEKSDVSDLDESPSAVTPVQRQGISSDTPIEKDITEKNCFHSYSISSSNNMKRRKLNSSEIPKFQTSSDGKNARMEEVIEISDSDDCESEGSPESPESPENLTPIVEEDNSSFSPDGIRASNEGFNNASKEPELHEQRIMQREYTSDNNEEDSDETGKREVVGSGQSINGFSSEKNLKLDNSFDNNLETPKINLEERKMTPEPFNCRRIIGDNFGNSCSPNSSTDGIEPGYKRIPSRENTSDSGKLTEEGDSEDNSLEDPSSLEPVIHRRATPFNKTIPGHEEADNGGDGNFGVDCEPEKDEANENFEVANNDDFMVENVEETNTADESTKLDNNKSVKILLYRSIEVDNDKDKSIKMQSYNRNKVIQGRLKYFESLAMKEEDSIGVDSEGDVEVKTNEGIDVATSGFGEVENDEGIEVADKTVEGGSDGTMKVDNNQILQVLEENRGAILKIEHGIEILCVQIADNEPTEENTDGSIEAAISEATEENDESINVTINQKIEVKGDESIKNTDNEATETENDGSIEDTENEKAATENDDSIQFPNNCNLPVQEVQDNDVEIDETLVKSEESIEISDEETEVQEHGARSGEEGKWERLLRTTVVYPIRWRKSESRDM
ncbi:hypothetical protein NHQ30_011395 [Ciborinia camelliae]|nr:hypothetical protein NHQ30_011395 [Ciborinia camelliae]